MAESTLELVFIEVLAKDEQLRASLQKTVDFAKAQAEQIRIALGSALSLKGDASLTRNLQQLTTATQGLSAAAAPVADRISRIRERLGTLDAQYKAGQVSTEQYKQRLEQLGQGLERTGQQAGLTQSNLRQIAEATTQARAGLDRVAKDVSGISQTADQIARLKTEALGLRAGYQAGLVGQEQFTTGMERVRSEAQRLAVGLDTASKEYKDVAQAARTAQASLDLDQGNLPKLGLAANVAAANVTVLNTALARLGPIGTILSPVIVRLQSQIAATGATASSSALGISAFGAATAALGPLIGAGIAAAAALGTVALVRFANRMTEVADPIAKGAQIAGLAVEDFQELRFAFDQSGINAEQFERAMGTLNQRIGEAADGTGTAVSAFKRLNVDIRDSEGALRPTIDIFDDFVTGLESIPASAQRAAIAADVFGERAGRQLAPLLNEGAEGIQALREQARELGLVISGSAITSLVAYKDEMNALRLQFESAKVELAAGMIPLLRGVLIPLIQNQVVPAVQAFSTSLNEAIVVLGSGTWRNNPMATGIREIAVAAVASVATLQALGSSLNILQVTFELAGAQLRETVRQAVDDIRDEYNRIQPFLQVLTPFSNIARIPEVAGGEDTRARIAALTSDLEGYRSELADNIGVLRDLDGVIDEFFKKISAGGGIIAGLGDDANNGFGELASSGRTATSILDDLREKLDAIDEQKELFKNLDVDEAKLTLIRGALVELTNIGLSSTSEAVQGLRADYVALGGEASDLKELTDALRAAHIALAQAFSSKIVLRTELGFQSPAEARAELEAAIGRVQDQIAAFEGVDLSTGEARAELDALVERLGIARAALDRINTIDLDPARTNFAKLKADLESGRQTISSVARQLDLLADGLATKLAAIEQGGLTELEIKAFIDTSALIEQVNRVREEVQARALDNTLLEVRMGLRPSAEVEDELRARLATLQEQIADFRPSIPIDLSLSDTAAVRAALDTALADAPDEFRALLTESDNLLAALQALTGARDDLDRAFTSNLELAVELQITDRATAQAALEGQIAELQQQLREQALQVDLTVGGEVDPVLQADIERTRVLLELYEQTLDRVAGKAVSLEITPTVDFTLDRDINLVREASDRFSSTLDNLRVQARALGQDFDVSSVSISTLEGILKGLLSAGVDPAGEAFGELAAQLARFREEQERVERFVSGIRGALGTFAQAARTVLAPLDDLVKLQGQVNDITGQTPSRLDAVTTALERFQQQGGLAAVIAGRLLAQLAPNITANPILDNVAATRSWIEAQRELGQVTRDEAVAALFRLRASLEALNVDFEKNPALAQAVADAIIGLTRDIGNLSTATATAGVLGSTLTDLRGIVDGLTTEAKTKFDTARESLLAFARTITPDDFSALTFIQEQFSLIAAADLDAARTSLEAFGGTITDLGRSAPSEFDRARESLQALLDALPTDQAAALSGLSAGLFAIIDAREAEAAAASVAALRDEFAALGVEAPSAFDEARAKLSQFIASLNVAPDQVADVAAQFGPLFDLISEAELSSISRAAGSLRTELLGLAEDTTEFDRARARVEAFFGALDPSQLSELGVSADELFGIIRGAELGDLEAQLLNLNRTTAEGFDESTAGFQVLRAALEGFGAETDEERAKVLELLSLLSEIEERTTARAAADEIALIGDEVDRLAGTGPSAFESLRERIEEFKASAELSAEQLKLINDLLGILGNAEAANELSEGMKQVATDLGNVAGIIRGINDLFDATSATDFVNAITGAASSFANLLPDGAAVSGVISAAGGLVSEFVSLVENLLSGGAAAVDAFVRDRAASTRLLTEEAVRALTVLQPPNLLDAIFGQGIDTEATDIGIRIAEGIASGMAGAFNADTLEEFRERFRDSLQQVVIDAAIEAAVLDASLQQQIAELAEAIAQALEDGVIDAAERANIDSLGKELERQAEAVWQQLRTLDLLGDNSGNPFGGTTPGVFEVPDVDPFRDRDAQFQSESLRVEQQQARLLGRLVELAENDPVIQDRLRDAPVSYAANSVLLGGG